MKILILYKATLFIAIFTLNFLKNCDRISYANKNDLKIEKVYSSDKTPLTNSDFDSLYTLAEVEDDWNENEVQSAYLLIKNSNFSFPNNKYKLTSCNYTNCNWYRFFGLPIYKAVRNFRI